MGPLTLEPAKNVLRVELGVLPSVGGVRYLSDYSQILVSVALFHALRQTALGMVIWKERRKNGELLCERNLSPSPTPPHPKNPDLLGKSGVTFTQPTSESGYSYRDCYCKHEETADFPSGPPLSTQP